MGASMGVYDGVQKMNLNGTGLDLSNVANDLLLELCASDDYVIAYEEGEICDPITGQCTSGTVASIPLDSALEDTASFGQIDSSNIKKGDIFLMVPPKVEYPTQVYWFVIRGVRYSIVDSMPFMNTGILQYTEFQLRSS